MERKTGSVRKTGSTRKTAALRKPEKGTAPLIVATALIGVWSQLIGFFSLYYGFRGNRLLLLFLFSILSPVVGVAVWNRLCKRNRWPFFTGGPENEPYGIYAFLWGMVTMFPIIFSVQILTSSYSLNSIYSVLTWFASRESGLILSYSFFAGLAAVLFYGFRRGHSLRSRLGSRPMGLETFDLVAVAVWAVVITSVPTLSVSLFANGATPFAAVSGNAVGYAAPVTLSLVVCLLCLSGYFYFSDYRRLDPKGMFKGFLVEFGMRCALFWGTWLLMDGRQLGMMMRLLDGVLKKEFDPLL